MTVPTETSGGASVRCRMCLDGGLVSRWEPEGRLDEPCGCPLGALQKRRFVRRNRLPAGLSEAELLRAYGGSEGVCREHAPEGE